MFEQNESVKLTVNESSSVPVGDADNDGRHRDVRSEADERPERADRRGLDGS